MRRALLLAVVVSGLLVAFAGVALADVITCMGGRCEGTERPDDIQGTDVRDRIFALGGFDTVDAGAGDDEINGQNGGDHIDGRAGNDTYNGGNGADLMHEFGTDTGRDVMNGGLDPDYLEGGVGPDILRGQDGDECPGDIVEAFMFGDAGNDDLFGGTGEDCMEGDAGTDEHFGGADNDFIDAANGEDPMTDAPDLVDCGGGIDMAVVRPNDIVRDNCENVDILATIAADSGTADDEERQQLRETFIQEHGLAPEPAG